MIKAELELLFIR